ncbi:MAG: tRNA (N(6)-L-threonylcarbamoyladenosine(37)-C(2))-methylthiotransferase MtaB [Patescibacteria group bacterium]|nr:tRNA (N(6)-L-threonylcarbamoyladenosine(37)-C(2))-methylthiotransferase MtaB [Patescibacteria group bacterium]
MRTIAICTLGCKLNQAEAEGLREKFEERGLKIVEPFQKADFYIINACAVTQKAEKETRQLISRIKRMFPKTYLIVIGCFTSILRLDREFIGKVDKWIDNKNKEKADKLILGQILKKKKGKNELKKKTRAFIKIQDGCRNYCSYCIVPYLRKEILNKPPQKIIQEIKNRERNGCQEIVLVGTNIGNYRIGKYDLKDLLREILDKTTIKRIRLTSFWPTLINQEFVKLIQNNPRICPHIHLSIQSASSEVLEKMNRPYSRKDLEKIIKQLKQIKDINLTADIIVGFPGESEKDFQETYNFVKSSQFLKIHVFKFSARPGTKASLVEDEISDKIKKIRSNKLIKLGEKLSEKQRKTFINSTSEALIENKRSEYWQGYTPNYLKVFFKSLPTGQAGKQNLTNQIVKVKLVKFYQDGFMGKFISL